MKRTGDEKDWPIFYVQLQENHIKEFGALGCTTKLDESGLVGVIIVDRQ